jgi:O-antigen ligase
MVDRHAQGGRSRVNVFGFLLTALYVPVISGSAVTGRWSVLAIGLPLLLLLLLRPLRITALHIVALILFAWCALTLCWMPNAFDVMLETIQFAFLLQAFFLGAALAEEDISRIFTGMACGLCLSSVMLFVQLGYPDVVQHTTTNSGLYVNSGALGEIAAVVLIALLLMRGRHGQVVVTALLAIGILPCVLMPQSRGAFLGLAAVFIAAVWSRSRLAAFVLFLVGFAGLIVSLRLGFHVGSVRDRISMWTDAIGGLTWLGHGIGSLWTDYAFVNRTYNIIIERPEHLHNDFLEIAFEGGLPGIFVCIAFGTCLFAGARRHELARLVLIGIAAECFVGFPLHMASTGFVAALCAGHLAREWADLRDVFGDRRPPLLRKHRPKHWVYDPEPASERAVVPA